MSNRNINEVIITGIIKEPLRVENSSGSIKFVYEAATQTLKVLDLVAELDLTSGEQI